MFRVTWVTTTQKNYWNQESSLTNTAELSFHCKFIKSSMRQPKKHLRQVIGSSQYTLKAQSVMCTKAFGPFCYILTYSQGNKCDIYLPVSSSWLSNEKVRWFFWKLQKLSQKTQAEILILCAQDLPQLYHCYSSVKWVHNVLESLA